MPCIAYGMRGVILRRKNRSAALRHRANTRSIRSTTAHSGSDSDDAILSIACHCRAARRWAAAGAAAPACAVSRRWCCPAVGHALGKRRRKRCSRPSVQRPTASGVSTARDARWDDRSSGRLINLQLRASRIDAELLCVEFDTPRANRDLLALGPLPRDRVLCYALHCRQRPTQQQVGAPRPVRSLPRTPRLNRYRVQRD
jgi:hypothetical protein